MHSYFLPTSASLKKPAKITRPHIGLSPPGSHPPIDPHLLSLPSKLVPARLDLPSDIPFCRACLPSFEKSAIPDFSNLSIPSWPEFDVAIDSINPDATSPTVLGMKAGTSISSLTDCSHSISDDDHARIASAV